MIIKYLHYQYTEKTTTIKFDYRKSYLINVYMKSNDKETVSLVGVLARLANFPT